MQRNVGRLEKWPNGNLLRFNKAKCKVLHQGDILIRDNLPYQSRLGDEGI